MFVFSAVSPVSLFAVGHHSIAHSGPVVTADAKTSLVII